MASPTKGDGSRYENGQGLQGYELWEEGSVMVHNIAHKFGSVALSSFSIFSHPLFSSIDGDNRKVMKIE